MRIGTLEEYLEIIPDEDFPELPEIHARFPFFIVVECCYPEMDFATRWCWQMFGPRDGDCYSQREYAACPIIVATEYIDKIRGSEIKLYRDVAKHHHEGTWTSYWLGKTEYDHGFMEFCFTNPQDLDRFREFVPEVSYGENYDFYCPKSG